MPVPNQSIYESDKNFKIDIEKVYTDIIQEIDKIRSVINISNGNNQYVLNALTKDSLTNLRQRLKVEEAAQESRCHAFFRLIGFPVVGRDAQSYYNPGLNLVKTWLEGNSLKVTTITSEKKIEISKSLIPGFRKLSLFRETYLYTDIGKVFAYNNTIDASTMALSSSTATREFSAASKNTKTTYAAESDFEVKDQSYDVDLVKQGLVGEHPGNISLYDYVDNVGASPTKILHKRYHVIIPFMVDPWIDFSVCPNSNIIAVPFVRSKDQLRIGVNDYAKRPFIEKVIRDRFTGKSIDPDGDYVKSLKQFISDNPVIQSSQLIQSVLTSAQGEEQAQFRIYLDIIFEMVAQLHSAQQKVRETQLKYYWLPIPSTTGPEGGVTVRPIMSQFSDAIAKAGLITPSDKDLIEAILKQSINKSNIVAVGATGTPDVGDFALVSPETSEAFTPDTTDAFGDLNADVIDVLTKKREQLMTEAGKALRTIEIIMGEFSGLGLCDVVAILGSLYVMPKDKILGFLDDDAFSRAKAVAGLTVPDTKPTVAEALESFTSTVKDFYVLMDTLYANHINSNNRS